MSFEPRIHVGPNCTRGVLSTNIANGRYEQRQDNVVRTRKLLQDDKTRQE